MVMWVVTIGCLMVGLKEAVLQSLLRERYRHVDLRERLRAAALTGRRDAAPAFGDVVVLARGQLYATPSGSLAFVQDAYRNECDDCYNARRCDRHQCQAWTPQNQEQLLALWTVKRLRHRDLHDKSRYEIEYTISPLNDATRNIVVRKGRFNYAIPGHVFVIKPGESHKSPANNHHQQIYNHKIPHNHYLPNIPIGFGDAGHQNILHSYPGFFTSGAARPPPTTGDPKEIELYNKLIEALASKTSTTVKAEEGPHKVSLNHYGGITGTQTVAPTKARPGTTKPTKKYRIPTKKPVYTLPKTEKSMTMTKPQTTDSTTTSTRPQTTTSRIKSSTTSTSTPEPQTIASRVTMSTSTLRPGSTVSHFTSPTSKPQTIPSHITTSTTITPEPLASHITSPTTTTSEFQTVASHITSSTTSTISPKPQTMASITPPTTSAFKPSTIASITPPTSTPKPSTTVSITPPTTTRITKPPKIASIMPPTTKSTPKPSTTSSITPPTMSTPEPIAIITPPNTTSTPKPSTTASITLPATTITPEPSTTASISLPATTSTPKPPKIAFIMPPPTTSTPKPSTTASITLPATTITPKPSTTTSITRPTMSTPKPIAINMPPATTITRKPSTTASVSLPATTSTPKPPTIASIMPSPTTSTPKPSTTASIRPPATTSTLKPPMIASTSPPTTTNTPEPQTIASHIDTSTPKPQTTESSTRLPRPTLPIKINMTTTTTTSSFTKPTTTSSAATTILVTKPTESTTTTLRTTTENGLITSTVDQETTIAPTVHTTSTTLQNETEPADQMPPPSTEAQTTPFTEILGTTQETTEETSAVKPATTTSRPKATTTASDFLTDVEPVREPINTKPVKEDYSLDDIFGSSVATTKPASTTTRVQESDLAVQLFGNAKVIFSGFYEASTKLDDMTVESEPMTSQSYETSISYQVNKRRTKESGTVKKPKYRRYKARTTAEPAYLYTTYPVVPGTVHPTRSMESILDYPEDQQVATHAILSEPSSSKLAAAEEPPSTTDSTEGKNVGTTEKVEFTTKSSLAGTSFGSTVEAFDDLATRLVNHARRIDYMSKASSRPTKARYKKRRTYSSRSRKTTRKRIRSR